MPQHDCVKLRRRMGLDGLWCELASTSMSCSQTGVQRHVFKRPQSINKLQSMDGVLCKTVAGDQI